MFHSGPYNALKVDVWSLGATVWELAESHPPFEDAADASELGETLPPLTRHAAFSQSFHDFLTQCSRPSSSRPEPDELLNVGRPLAYKQYFLTCFCLGSIHSIRQLAFCSSGLAGAV